MSAPRDVFERNVEALITRAYQPVRPTQAFVAQLMRRLPLLMREIGGKPEPAARRVSPWPGRIVAAAALVFIVVTLVPRYFHRLRELGEILADGYVAVTTNLQTAWVAWDEPSFVVGESLAGKIDEGLLIAVTPSGRGVELQGGRGPIVQLDADSRASILTTKIPQDARTIGGDSLGTRVQLEFGTMHLEYDGSLHTHTGSADLVLYEGRLLYDESEPELAELPAPRGIRTPLAPEQEAPPAVATSGSLEGRVTLAPEDRATERFRVLLLRAVDLPRVAEPEWRDFEDPDGLFRWEGLESGVYSMFVQAAGRAQFGRHGLVLAEGGKLEIDANLHIGATVRGYVVDRTSGEPIENALVLSQTDAPMQVLPRYEGDDLQLVTARTRTRADGSFELRNLSVGEHELRASGLEHAPAWIHTLSLRDGEVLDGPLFELGTGGTVFGRVEEDGRPRARSVIIASQFGGSSPARAMTFDTGITDEEGRYEIPFLSPGMYVVLHLGHEDTYEQEQPEISSITLRLGERQRVDFVQLPELGRLHGRVSLAGGAPFVGGTVSIARCGAKSSVGWIAVATSDEGEYTLENVEPGCYQVHVGRGAGLTLQAEVEVEAAAVTELDLRLSSGTIHGEVRDAGTGEPLRDSIVLLVRHVQPNGNEEFPCFEPLLGKAWSTGSSSFEFPFLADGVYDLVACGALGTHGGHAQTVIESVELREGARVERDVELSPGGSLELHVTDASGAAIPLVEAELHDPRGRRIDVFMRSTSWKEGRASWSKLEVGLWRVVVSAPGFAPRELSASVEASSIEKLEITLRR